MLRVTRQNITGLKYPAYASLVLAFASLGDAFLYPFLPQHAASWEIPVIWIGMLLSINRLIRIVFNPLVLVLFARYGVRQATIIASGIAIISTIGYGLGWGLASLIVFRILWGMSFAVLRISTVAYAFEHTSPGLSLGTSKSIQELGPVFGLWVGPALLTYFSDYMTFLVLGMLSLPSLLYAYRLPDLGKTKLPVGNFSFKWPSLFNSMTFFLSFIIEGVLIVILGAILIRNNVGLTSWMVTSLAAGLLAYRRICFIFFSPVSGILADRIGFSKMFNGSMLFIIAGIAFILVGWEMMGLVVVFAFNSVNSAMAPGGVAEKQEDKLKAITTNASWRDIGAAAGTLTGGFLLSGIQLSQILIIAIFILGSLLFLNLMRSNPR